MKRTIFFICGVFALFQVSSQIPLDSLIGYWPLNGNANDLSGNMNNGNVFGAVLAIDRFGNSNSSYFFDGIDDKIVCSTDNYGVTSVVSVSAWMRADTGNYPCLVDKYDPNFDRGYVLRLRAFGNACFEGRDGNSVFVSAASDPDLYMQKWHHLVGITDHNVWKIWVDNVLLDSIDDNHSSVDLQNNVSLIFGALSIPANGNYRYFQGWLDDIRIYKKVLTPQEITALYYEEPTENSIESEDSYLNIYPNPSNGYFALNLKNLQVDKKYSVEVYNSIGQIILNSKIKDGQNMIDLSGKCSKGLYQLIVRNSENRLIGKESIIIK